MRDLPVDPEAIAASDRGERRVTLDCDHETAVDRTRDALTDAGFAIVVEFTPSEIVAKQLDRERPPYHVVGACIPSIADRALDEVPLFGSLLPCNVVVHEVEPGAQCVEQVNVLAVAALAGVAEHDEAWRDLGEKVDAAAEDAFARLGDAEER